MIEIIHQSSGPYYTVQITYPGYLQNGRLSPSGEEFLRYLIDSLAQAKQFAAAKMVDKFRDNAQAPLRDYQHWTVEAFEKRLHIQSVEVENPNQAKYRFSFRDIGASHEIDVVMNSESEPQPVIPSIEKPDFSTPPTTRHRWVA